MTLKQRNILIQFLLWFITLFLIIFIGVNKIFADTYDAQQYSAQLYDNYGPSLSAVSTNFTNMSWRGTIPTMVANSSGAAWGISSPIVLLANHTYSMSIRIEGTYGGLLLLSTYNRIGVGTSLSNAVSSYQNNTYATENYSKVVSNEPIIQFAFTPTINANYIVFPFATNYSGNNQSFYLYNVIIDDLGTSGISESTINNSLNNQTNVLNNSITNSTNQIQGSLRDTEDSINNTITDNFNNKCENLLDKSNYIIDNNGYLGFIISGLENGKTYTLSSNNNFDYYKFSTCLYCGPEVSGPEASVNSNSVTFTITDNSRYLFFEPSFSNFITNINQLDNYEIMLVEGSSSKTYCEYGSSTNKLDEAEKTRKGILGKLGDLFNSFTSFVTNLFDTSGPDTNGLGNVAGWLPAGPVDSILTLPLSLINAILGGLGSSCSPLQVPLPFVSNTLTLPCINILFSQINGVSTLYTWLGPLASAFILYYYFKALYKWIDEKLSLKDDSEWGGV